MTFEGGGVYGWFGLGKNFIFPKALVTEFYFLTYNGVRIFSSICYERYYFFSARRNFFCQVFPCKSFFPVNQSAEIFFSEITHIPLKSQMVIPL